MRRLVLLCLMECMRSKIKFWSKFVQATIILPILRLRLGAMKAPSQTTSQLETMSCRTLMTMLSWNPRGTRSLTMSKGDLSLRRRALVACCWTMTTLWMR
jgi:hypothetical protein